MNASEHLQAARNTLLVEIASFVRERGITETTFGRLAVNDGKFVARLRSTENMTTGLIERAHDFIRDGRAANAASPAEPGTPREAAA
jgi:hypothetical protein